MEAAALKRLRTTDLEEYSGKNRDGKKHYRAKRVCEFSARRAMVYRDE